MKFEVMYHVELIDLQDLNIYRNYSIAASDGGRARGRRRKEKKGRERMGREGKNETR